MTFAALPRRFSRRRITVCSKPRPANSRWRSAQAEKAPIDLLLTDVVLGGINGRELSEQFRLLHPEARVLFASGYADDVIARRGVQQGSIAFLPKPYSAEGLRERVMEVLSAG